MNKKLFANTILIVLLLSALIGIAYVCLYRKVTTSVSTEQPTTQNSTTTMVVKNQSAMMEKVDLLKYLAKKYESANPGKGIESCPIGSTELQNFSNRQKSVSYGFITENNLQSAVVNYRTCFNGTGGGNSEVYTVDTNGNIINFTPDSTKLSRADYKKFFDSFGGHGYFGISASKLIYTYPIYNPGDSNASPTGGVATITFKWSGNKFTYDTLSIDSSVNN